MSNTLFSPFRAGDLTLPNRIVMAPMTRNRCPGGVPDATNALYYAQRASAGLIVSEGTAITQQGQGYAGVPGLYTPEQLDGWRNVTRAVREQGGRIVCQLWHVGRVSNSRLQPGEQPPVAPSAIKADAKAYLINKDGVGGFTDTSSPRALEKEEIPGIAGDFANAALAAIDAGFDGVEIHAANGYLLDQFLKTGTNQRKDAYGGSIANRSRLLLDVVRAVTSAVGAGKTGIRLSPVSPINDIHDANPQPLFEYVLQNLATFALAYIHMIEGATGGPRVVPDSPFDYSAARQSYQQAGGLSAWMVNNSYDQQNAEEAVRSGHADLVAFGRLFVSNPDLVERMRTGAPLNPLNDALLYGGGEAGYTDYPALVQG